MSSNYTIYHKKYYNDNKEEIKDRNTMKRHLKVIKRLINNEKVSSRTIKIMKIYFAMNDKGLFYSSELLDKYNKDPIYHFKSCNSCS